MLFLITAVAASAWLVGAQDSDGSTGIHTHAVFAFIRTGERTPVTQPGAPVLSALGANQMYSLGENFRARYITGGGNGALGEALIANMSQNLLNNDQIAIQTLDTAYLSSSAQAFMQGLYPPHGTSNGTGDATGLLATGSVLDFPLNGYQYPNIRTSSLSDPTSRFVDGFEGCFMAQQAAQEVLASDRFLSTASDSQDFYDSLPRDWFQGCLNDNYEINFSSAIEIDDCLSYQYAHNSTIYNLLRDDSRYAGALDRVRYLADEKAWYLFGNTSTASDDANIRAVAGRTLAYVVLSQFWQMFIDRNSGGDPTDMSYPMVLFFGEQIPMISLISLIMADYHNTWFHSIPEFGSAMIFELFSTGTDVEFPSSEDDLWVRFSFHNGTGYENNQLIAFPIFGNGPSGTDMPFHEFKQLMIGTQMQSTAEWCDTCASASDFCRGVDMNNITLIVPARQRNLKVSPTVAGVIGAFVALAVAGLLFALAMLLGGIRLHRVSKKNSELGGFKGSAKLASDPDLSLAKNAAPVAGIVSFGDAKARKGHERVGSWELRQKEFGKDVGGESPRASFDAIDAVATKPVQPRESV